MGRICDVKIAAEKMPWKKDADLENVVFHHVVIRMAQQKKSSFWSPHFCILHWVLVCTFHGTFFIFFGV